MNCWSPKTLLIIMPGNYIELLSNISYFLLVLKVILLKYHIKFQLMMLIFTENLQESYAPKNTA